MGERGKREGEDNQKVRDRREGLRDREEKGKEGEGHLTVE